MKEILILSDKDYDALDLLLGTYIEELKEMDFPTLGYVTIRRHIKSVCGASILLSYHVSNKGYLTIKAQGENSPLMMNPRKPKSFEIVLDINTPEAKILKADADPEAIEWLNKEVDKDGHTNLQRLLSYYIPSDYVINYCRPLLNTNGNGELFPVKDFHDIVGKYTHDMITKYRREHLTDGWDVVSLTDNQLIKVLQTIYDNRIEIEHENTSLTRFCLALYSTTFKSTQYWFFERNGKELYVKSAIAKPTDKKLGFIVEIGDDSVKLTTHTDDFLTQERENDEPMWQYITRLYFCINSFMLHFGDVTMEIETKTAQAQSEKKQSKKHHHSTVRMFKTYKLIRNWKSQARKKVEITCPAWGVRGHYRHYKNGKVVFIEGFVKGKDRANYKGKEYALMPYSEA